MATTRPSELDRPGLNFKRWASDAALLYLYRLIRQRWSLEKEWHSEA